MSRTRLASDLLSDVRIRADVENETARFPDSLVLEFVNQSAARLQNKVIVAGGSVYVLAETSYSGDGSTVLFGLQANFFQLNSVRLDLGNNVRIPLEPFTELEEARLESIPLGTGSVVNRYRLRPGNIEVLPALPQGKTLWVKYIQVTARMAGTDTFDGFNGWEEWIVLDAAQKIATRQKMWELVTTLRTDKQEFATEIMALATKRDRGRPERVQDVRSLRRFARLAKWRQG